MSGPSTSFRAAFRARNRRLPRLAGLVLLALAAGFPSALFAFHEGGVAQCEGCHVTHSGPAGVPVVEDGLLLGANATDTCLRCHATASGNTWGTDALAPGPIYGGGAFVFLTEDNLNDSRDGSDPTQWIGGHRAGHNVISLERGTLADPENAVAPGGSYPSSSLQCTSCHDPHDRGGNYRMLYGSDFPDASVEGFVFTYSSAAPEAVGIALDGPPESDAHHNAYVRGMAEWCGNCHGGVNIHEGTLSRFFQHPGDQPLGTELSVNYNDYQGTGEPQGPGTDAYVVHVPVEDPFESSTSFRGPVRAGARLMCLSCHRAHASSAPHAGRWDFNIETWADEGAVSGSYPIPNPYAATAGPSQRELCEKCHGPDDIPQRGLGSPGIRRRSP